MKQFCRRLAVLPLVALALAYLCPSLLAQQMVKPRFIPLQAAQAVAEQVSEPVELTWEEFELIPEGLRKEPLYPPEKLPSSATFYSLQRTYYPPLPYNPLGRPCWDLGDNIFLMQDVKVDYVTLEKEAKELAEKEAAEKFEGGEKDGGGGMMRPSAIYSTNDLWLEITGVSNSTAFLILNGTVPDVAYEILSRVNLDATNWQSEGMLLGAPGAAETGF